MKQARVLGNKKIDLKVTPITSIDIQRIEAEFQREEKDQASKKLVDITLADDLRLLSQMLHSGS